MKSKTYYYQLRNGNCIREDMLTLCLYGDEVVFDIYFPEFDGQRKNIHKGFFADQIVCGWKIKN